MSEALKKRIRAAAEPATQPDGESVQVLDAATVARLADTQHADRRAVEIAALESGILPLRYARNFNTYDRTDQITLLNSHVAVIGLGGLGGAVSLALARVGVGQLTLVDGDRFAGHNLNRQALCTETDLDKPKAAVAARRIAGINGACWVQAHDTFLDENNATTLLQDAQVVIDCLDNIPSRFTLEAAAKQMGIPLVSAAVGGEAGHLMVVYPEDRGLELIYGLSAERSAVKGAETVLGCLPHIVTLMANLEVNEALNILRGRDTNLRGRMLLVDLAGGLFETVDLQG
jgi:molybdopterin/thiamine biosynthesis adenylyltransferase